MIPAIERKAALTLFPYFSRDGAIVFDVGSNKGEWADVLIHNVGQITLFEANELLLDYTRVKYDYLRNVKYLNYAICDLTWKQIDFYYFTNENNGLSSIFNNPKWDELPRKVANVHTMRLDDVERYGLIDFLKIDVEGAEYLVLRGAEKLLLDNQIKFIQVEYADHIALSGHSFQGIIDFVTPFGYALFHFDGEYFIKVDRDPSEYHAENFYFMDQNFSQDWNTEFIANTRGLKFDFVLEIGCFEGLTSKYICENLLNPGGRMICLDPLTDEYLPGHKDNEMFAGQYDRFIRNTRNLPVELIRKKSVEAFGEMEHYRFGLIYVDGDHREDAVYLDAINAFTLCLIGGYILFDDYEGYDEGTTRGINRFLSEMPTRKMTVIKKGYQVLVQKHENMN